MIESGISMSDSQETNKQKFGISKQSKAGAKDQKLQSCVKYRIALKDGTVCARSVTSFILRTYWEG